MKSKTLVCSVLYQSSTGLFPRKGIVFGVQSTVATTCVASWVQKT
jgi:hypothetical protein